MLAKTYLLCCKIQEMFNSGKKLGCFFSFKHEVLLNSRSLFYDDIFVGRMIEHLGISLSAGLKAKVDEYRN